MGKVLSATAFAKVFLERGYTLDEWLDELRVTSSESRTAIIELIDDHATFKTVVDDIKALVNSIKSSFTAGLLSAPTLVIGSGDKTAVAHSAFYYMIAGTIYAKTVDAAGIEPGNDVVTQNKFGAVAFDIGIDGTIHATEAAANAAGYDSAVLAIAGIPAVAAAHVRMGTVTAMDTDAAFTFATVALDHPGSTVAYTDGAVGIAIGGTTVSTSSPATLSAPDPSAVPFEFTP